MERIKQKIIVLQNALKTLSKGVQFFHEYEKIFNTNPSSINEEFYMTTRDSMIQRFEYCVDLFWKTLKLYLEDKEKIEIAINSPRGIIREAVKAKIITEQDGERFMEMVECRNKTSHIYHQEMAEAIAKQIPHFYSLINATHENLKTRLETA